MSRHRLTQTIHIATLDEGGDDAFLNVYSQVGPVSDGFCAKILWAGSSIGGAVGGIVGGVFGLATFYKVRWHCAEQAVPMNRK